MQLPVLPDNAPWFAYPATLVSIIVLGALVYAVKTLIDKFTLADKDRAREANDLHDSMSELIDVQIEKNDTIQELNERVASVENIGASNANALRDVKSSLTSVKNSLSEFNLQLLRGQLFMNPQSRAEHEELLNVGEQYMRAGGNGAGHARYMWLQERYKKRSDLNDWDYSHTILND